MDKNNFSQHSAQCPIASKKEQASSSSVASLPAAARPKAEAALNLAATGYLNTVCYMSSTHSEKTTVLFLPFEGDAGYAAEDDAMNFSFHCTFISFSLIHPRGWQIGFSVARPRTSWHVDRRN